MKPKDRRRQLRERIQQHELREQYRRDLHEARNKHGNWIPFGYDLNKLE